MKTTPNYSSQSTLRISSCKYSLLLGSSLTARDIAIAMANCSQSLPPFCLRHLTCWIASNLHRKFVWTMQAPLLLSIYTQTIFIYTHRLSIRFTSCHNQWFLLMCNICKAPTVGRLWAWFCNIVSGKPFMCENCILMRRCSKFKCWSSSNSPSVSIRWSLNVKTMSWQRNHWSEGWGCWAVCSPNLVLGRPKSEFVWCLWGRSYIGFAQVPGKGPL